MRPRIYPCVGNTALYRWSACFGHIAYIAYPWLNPCVVNIHASKLDPGHPSCHPSSSTQVWQLSPSSSLPNDNSLQAHLYPGVAILSKLILLSPKQCFLAIHNYDQRIMFCGQTARSAVFWGNQGARVGGELENTLEKTST